MAKLKTKATEVSVDSFLNGVADDRKREDAFKLVEMMKEITGAQPRMWGPSMVGFGEYHYVYASGHEGDTFLAGFSPRKDALVVYFMAGLDRFPAQLEKLGKAKASKGCLYIKKLADVDVAVLRDMIQANVGYLRDMAKAKKEANQKAAKKKGEKKK